jgi:phytoene dehydrogenase-like protein
MSITMQYAPYHLRGSGGADEHPHELPGAGGSKEEIQNPRPVGQSKSKAYASVGSPKSPWDGPQRQALVDTTLDTLAGYAPNLKELIHHCQIITPLDWEQEYGLTEGNIFHGEMSLDQLLFMRPVPGYGQYRTPIDQLYLCGAGTHPGGGVTGAPGYNAAREILKDLKR